MQISIITASYNYEEYIKETIESVIAQTYTDWEMVIVDDGSKDNSVEVIKSYCEQDSRIKLYQHENGENKGLIETVKLGIEKAQNGWIVFLESDDTITSDYLETKLEIIKQYPDVKFIFNDVNMFGDEDRIHGMKNLYFKKIYKELNKYSFPTNVSTAFAKRNIIPTFSCVMLKKELFDGIDFNVAKKPCLDYYIWSQIAQNNDFYYINKKLTNWRMHKDSYISSKVQPLVDLKFEYQINNINYKKKPIKRFVKNLKASRKSILRIHFKDAKICFMGQWYYLKKGQNEESRSICSL